MSCPRCDAPLDEAAVLCPACGAPLQLRDEAHPPPLDRPLDLDRRRTRTPIPASTPPPAAAELDEGDLGDLSFDAPADDGPWTMATPEAAPGEPEVAAESAAEDQAPIDEPDEAQRDTPWGDGAFAEPSGWTDLRTATGPRLFADDATAPRLSADDPEVFLGEVPDEEEDPPAEISDHDRIRRGRLLSMVSIAIASAAALVAVLSSS